MNDPMPIYSSVDASRVNAFMIRELLESAEIDSQDTEEKDTGMMLNVRMEWKCYVDSGEGCDAPELQVSSARPSIMDHLPIIQE